MGQKKYDNSPSANWFDLPGDKNSNSIARASKAYLSLAELLLEIDEYIKSWLIDMADPKNWAARQEIAAILKDIKVLRQKLQGEMDNLATNPVRIALLQKRLSEVSKEEGAAKRAANFLKAQRVAQFRREYRDDEDDTFLGYREREDRRSARAEEYEDECDEHIYERGDDYSEQRKKLQQELAIANEMPYSRLPISGLENELDALWGRHQALRILPKPEVSSQAASKQVEPKWYTEDDVAELLHTLLPDQDRYEILAQTQLENAALLQDNLKQAIANIIVNPDLIVLMPVHIHGNHWIGIMIHMQADGDFQVVIVNPMGEPIEAEANAPLLALTLTGIVNELSYGENQVHIVDLQLRQQYDDFSCGRLTGINLGRLAEAAAAGRLDNLDRKAIVEIADLQWPGDGDAWAIGMAHNDLFEEIAFAGLPSLEEVEEFISEQEDPYRSSEESDELQLDPVNSGLIGLAALLLWHESFSSFSFADALGI